MRDVLGESRMLCLKRRAARDQHIQKQEKREKEADNRANRLKRRFSSPPLLNELTSERQLNAILGWARLLRSGANSIRPKQEQAIEIVEAQCRCAATDSSKTSSMFSELLRANSASEVVPVGTLSLAFVEAAIDSLDLQADAKGRPSLQPIVSTGMKSGIWRVPAAFSKSSGTSYPNAVEVHSLMEDEISGCRPWQIDYFTWEIKRK
jgi:hypothetical protein